MKTQFFTLVLIVSLGITGNTSQAQTSEWALFVDQTSNVGVGTETPSAQFHVSDDFDAKILVENTGTTSGFNTKVMFNIVNNGGVRFDMLDESTGSNWVFQNQYGTFDVTLAGTGTREFRFYPNGNLEISGSYLQLSSRTMKHGIESVDPQAVLEKVAALPITLWSYHREEGVRHMGPMAEDFYASFNLGGTDKAITTVDAGGVALAAIQGLKKEKDAEIAKLTAEAAGKDREIADLQAQLQLQDDRVMQLEIALAEVLRKQSSGVQVGSAD